MHREADSSHRRPRRTFACGTARKARHRPQQYLPSLCSRQTPARGCSRRAFGDLGDPAPARIPRYYGYTVDELRKLWGGTHEVLRIELFLNDEAGTWHYRVPALHINGGWLPSRHDAVHDCLPAIAFALEGNPVDYGPTAETLTLDVTVAPAA